jgi:hypothetical protein
MAVSQMNIEQRLDAVDWPRLSEALDAQGWAIMPKLLSHAEADALVGLYPQDEGFRSRVVMARHGFGRVSTNTSATRCRTSSNRCGLRPTRTSRRSPTAGTSAWASRRASRSTMQPSWHAATRPANCVRRPAARVRPGRLQLPAPDLYGEHVFPLQIAILLDEPGEDFWAASS